ncbi:hypothetical protein D9757_004208 [Collybiopsis confluens]|uniref:Uncharacterized protein n=1 Tax=Collybiopsis confluens TaxID=2823264 RepID=A0A8H5HU73_9AGAR|nr:hypothetical protein D9757_004208 [Collybiopsis confluens]
MPPNRPRETLSNIYEERIELLDKLIELPLKGFPEIDTTPTSGVTSLPTPHADEHTPLDDPVNPPNEYVYLTVHTTASLTPSSSRANTYPPTPRIKDLDSFTEGTGGSFDFLAEEDSLAEPAPLLNSLSLSLLPPQESLVSIEIWREDVYYNSPNSSEPPSRLEEAVDVDSDPMMSDSSSYHSKRPRSIASDDVARRTRLRAQSFSTASFSLSSQFFTGVEPPMPDVRPFIRPQLRRTRSLPLHPD